MDVTRNIDHRTHPVRYVRLNGVDCLTGQRAECELPARFAGPGYFPEADLNFWTLLEGMHPQLDRLGFYPKGETLPVRDEYLVPLVRAVNLPPEAVAR